MAKRSRSRTKTGRWSAEEVKKLKKIFRNMSTAEVAEELGRSVPSVAAKAYFLGLRKTKKYLRSIGRA